MTAITLLLSRSALLLPRCALRFSAECVTSAADCVTVTADCVTIAAEYINIAAKCVTIAAVSVTIIEECVTTVAECVTITAEYVTIAAEKEYCLCIYVRRRRNSRIPVLRTADTVFARARGIADYYVYLGEQTNIEHSYSYSYRTLNSEAYLFLLPRTVHVLRLQS
jgi:hypothetical protein